MKYIRQEKLAIGFGEDAGLEDFETEGLAIFAFWTLGFGFSTFFATISSINHKPHLNIMLISDWKLLARSYR